MGCVNHPLGHGSGGRHYNPLQDSHRARNCGTVKWSVAHSKPKGQARDLQLLDFDGT